MSQLDYLVPGTVAVLAAGLNLWINRRERPHAALRLAVGGLALWGIALWAYVDGGPRWAQVLFVLFGLDAVWRAITRRKRARVQSA